MSKALMTNLASPIYDLLHSLAKKHKTTKRHLLEQMIIFYYQHQEEASVQQAYATMSKDETYLQEMQDNSLLLGSL